MARRPRPRRSDDDDKQPHRGTEKRRRLHVLANDHDRGFSMYELNVDHFDSDSEDDDMDSSARRLGDRRLVVRLAGSSGHKFLAVRTRIFNLFPGSDRPSVVFDTRTQLVTTTPPFQTPKQWAAFWTVGRTLYALDRGPPCRRFREGSQPGCFERLGREPRPGHGKWQWEALPEPPFGPLGDILSHAVHPDGATVFLSVDKAGTFSFDGERLAWARHGGWLLPFDGEAYYVGELDAWVGISTRFVGHIVACPVLDGRRNEAAAVEPTCKHGKDLLFSKRLERHLAASLTYMGDAEFCLQETLTPEGETMVSTFGLQVRMLLRVVTFRVKYSRDGELRAVDRRTRIYKLPQRSSDRRPFGFWI